MTFIPFEEFEDIELSPQISKYIIRFYCFCFCMILFHLIYY